MVTDEQVSKWITLIDKAGSERLSDDDVWIDEELLFEVITLKSYVEALEIATDRYGKIVDRLNEYVGILEEKNKNMANKIRICHFCAYYDRWGRYCTKGHRVASSCRYDNHRHWEEAERTK